MWYTYDQRIYMYVYIRVYELCGHEVRQSCFLMCLLNFTIRWILFQSQVRQAASAAGDMFIGHGMNQHQQFRSITTWFSHHHTAMWYDFMSMTFHYSKFFVPIPLPPYCIKWCQHFHDASSDASSFSPILCQVNFSFPISRQCLRTMALLPVQPDLQALFAPILHTQRELARAHEIICQVDDLSDFTDEHHLQEASLHPINVRQRLRAVCTLLKLRLTIQMIQLARFFRNHFRQNNNIPIVNLDFRWVHRSIIFESQSSVPTHSQSAPHWRQSTLHPNREKRMCQLLRIFSMKAHNMTCCMAAKIGIRT